MVLASESIPFAYNQVTTPFQLETLFGGQTYMEIVYETVLGS